MKKLFLVLLALLFPVLIFSQVLIVDSVYTMNNTVIENNPYSVVYKLIADNFLLSGVFWFQFLLVTVIITVERLLISENKNITFKIPKQFYPFIVLILTAVIVFVTTFDFVFLNYILSVSVVFIFYNLIGKRIYDKLNERINGKESGNDT